MRKHITIRNFGPISKFESDIKKVNIFIGPQASGKSTIAKAYFLVRNVKNEIYQYIMEIKNKSDITHLIGNLNKILRKRFIQIFGKTKVNDLGKFEIIYRIENEKFLKFYLDEENWVKVLYSSKLKAEIEDLKKYLYELLNVNQSLKKDPLNEEIYINRTRILHIILEKLNKIFGEQNTITYIPAGRTLLTLFGEYINTTNIEHLDYITNVYIKKMLNLKKLFENDLEELIETFKKLETRKLDYPKVKLAIDLIYKILKGKYRLERGEERIYFDKNKYVRINYASSGQQEALWILNFIYYEILYSNKSTLIVEEPEAHLFPDAQKEIVNLLSLFTNTQKENELIVTTHSPYILTSFNNIIYASSVYKKLKNNNGTKVEEIVKKEFFIDFNDVNAFFIHDGIADSILDEEVKQIQAEKIDKISEKINEEFDKLIDLEYSEEVYE